MQGGLVTYADDLDVYQGSSHATCLRAALDRIRHPHIVDEAFLPSREETRKVLAHKRLDVPGMMRV